jgi:hypothetical protein
MKARRTMPPTTWSSRTHGRRFMGEWGGPPPIAVTVIGTGLGSVESGNSLAVFSVKGRAQARFLDHKPRRGRRVGTSGGAGDDGGLGPIGFRKM